MRAPPTATRAQREPTYDIGDRPHAELDDRRAIDRDDIDEW
jgi:hypothetical protein